MPTIKEIESWLTVQQAAEALGVTRKTLYAWLEDGRLRAAHTAHGWIVDPVSVAEYGERRQKRETAAQRERRATMHLNDLNQGAPR